MNNDHTKMDPVAAALAAALLIQQTLRKDVTLDIAIHVGDVHYGNIGAAERLDFTVIGSAVNEVARLESLCSVIGESVLVSAEAAERIGRRGLCSRGVQRLRGFDKPREVFAPVVTASDDGL